MDEPKLNRIQKSDKCILVVDLSSFIWTGNFFFPFQKLAWGKISNNFKIGTLNVPENVQDSVIVDFKLWILSRHKKPIVTIKARLFGTKYSRMGQVIFVEDTL